MLDLKVGDKVKVKDRMDWPGKYALADTIGTIIELQKSSGYAVIHVDETKANVMVGTTLVFRSDAVEKIKHIT